MTGSNSLTVAYTITQYCSSPVFAPSPGASAIAAGILIFIAFYFRRKLSSYNSTESCLNIETFLWNYESQAPKRYCYVDIKKMTNYFKHQLGQGGYGVKLLNNSKGNGEEFINEVASISRTSHVNIVTLLGFCFEGRRRALIYDLSTENHELTRETLLQIVVGVARELEHLHLGCST
ncbi:hypothetical protein CUMW_105510 [Citrus unshiu]|uniref:Protein kinase domain-containing protein n=1 Tax=Citrus unshiu TaxID=55188 RepID=A0A2H5P5D4_CITUN|nr:hypothetical protein CUMW_105510 [Citrus unshiu]